MAAKISCPQCQRLVQVPEGLPGQRFRCPVCAETLIIPDSSVPALPVVTAVPLPDPRPSPRGPLQPPSAEPPSAQGYWLVLLGIGLLGVLAVVVGVGGVVGWLLSPSGRGSGGPRDEPAARTRAEAPRRSEPVQRTPAPESRPDSDARPGLPALVARLKHADAAVRRKAAEALGERGPDARSAVPDLIPLLKDSDPAVARAAATALEQIGPPSRRDYPVLVTALTDDSRAVRAYAAGALAQPGVAAAADAGPALARAVRDPDRAVRKAVVQALGSLGPDGKRVALPALLSALRDEDAGVAGQAEETLPKLGPPARSDREMIATALKDTHPRVRRYAASVFPALGLGAPEALPLLVPALADSEADVRASAALALGQFGPQAKSALPALLPLVKDRDPAVRRQAVRSAAAVSRDREVVAALLDALGDADAEVGQAAGDELLRLDVLGKEHVPALDAALRSDRPAARRVSAAALGKLGPDAAGAVPDLIRAVKDSDLSVRIEAVRALGAVGPEARTAVPVLADVLTERGPDAPPAIRTDPEAEPGTASGERVYQRALKSTTWILTEEPTKISSGSGWLVDAPRRLVVTNAHVVGNNAFALVFFPVFDKDQLVTEPAAYVNNWRTLGPKGVGRRARVVARDPTRDLAILELPSLPPGAPALPLARHSAGAGETVHSIGASGVNLRALEGALWRYSQGQVRQVYQREIRYASQTVRAFVVETQSPTNPGDSGGPVVNGRGELVAVTEGASTVDRLVSFSIDVREVTAFVTAYLRSVGDNGTLTAPRTPVPAGPLAASGSHADLRRAAVVALGRLGRDAAPALMKALRDKDPAVRREALAGVGRLGPDAASAVGDLIDALESPELQADAVAVLGKIGKPAVPALTAALGDKKPGVRAGACLALGEIGPAARTAILPLSNLLRDRNAEVRAAASEALAKVQRKK